MAAADAAVVVEKLRAGRERIGVPARWCRKQHAVIIEGREVAWCALGAMRHEFFGTVMVSDISSKSGGREYAQCLNLLRGVAIRKGYSHIEHLNDLGTHGEVIAMFDGAIEAALAAPEVASAK